MIVLHFFSQYVMGIINDILPLTRWRHCSALAEIALSSLSSKHILVSRRSRQRERLSASVLSICLFVSLSVCLSPKCKNAIFSKTKQFRAMVAIDDL